MRKIQTAATKLGKFLFPAMTLILLFRGIGIGQVKQDSLNKTRLNTFLLTTGVVYTGSMIALNQLWYSDYPKENFHFFDDSREWYQMDKVGHLYSTFHLSQASSRAFRWAGMAPRKSDLMGTALGMAMMIPIEILDGYSSQYGASNSDLIANLAGASFYLGQQLLWDQVRIHPKFSFSKSGLAPYRPEVLGKNTKEQLLKDYNGQTYWLSFDIHSLSKVGPKWLNLAVGYGVQNMINANGSPTTDFPYSSYRQYYLALDFDLTHIHSSSKAINTLIYFVNLIHLPAPALEFSNENKVIFHPLQF